MNTALSFLYTACLRNTLFSFGGWKKSNSFSWNWQVFVSGQLTIFSLPVMKVVAGVNALGGNGGLFIPLKAQRHTCFAWSVICNCGISWEAQEQSTLCFERVPSARLKTERENQTKTPFSLFYFAPSQYLYLNIFTSFSPSITDIYSFLPSSLRMFGYFESNWLFFPYN